MPRMRLLRRYPFGGRIYSIGAVADFPEQVCRTMERGKPPFGERMDEPAELDERPPAPPEPTAEPESTPTEDE